MKIFLFIILIAFLSISYRAQSQDLMLNDKEYFEKPGLNVMVFTDIYPEGHQGGVGIIQNGVRTATNGDIRLEPAPGQWSPIPIMKKREVDKSNNQIRVSLTYPDSARNRKGFNPIDYPDLYFNYTLTVKDEGIAGFSITVDLDRPLPAEWIGKVGFNIELFPGALFGKSWMFDKQSGIFPRQANGPGSLDGNQQRVPVAYGSGPKLVIAGECDAQRMVIESKTGDLQLIDGRSQHNNGWFVVRSLVPSGATKGAIYWLVNPNALPGWISQPVVHVSQIGYHPQQTKIAVIETDPGDHQKATATLFKISDTGNHQAVLTDSVKTWGNFLRYTYLQFNFTKVNQEGMYFISYKNYTTQPFRIAADVYQRHVWQPVLEYFLPIQMCHMRVNENYRVWHGECHTDDALMAPVDFNHFDGYAQGKSTLTKYKPMDHVPGLNIGGWHDAGDDDLRVESQSGEVFILSEIYEAFQLNYDNTLIDQQKRLTEIQHPDGKNDLLQQIEHGTLSVVSGYQNLGRLYRGIICPTLSQYVMMGDVSNQTDKIIYNPAIKADGKTATQTPDDRWVFTENNPGREISTAAHLAAASRVLKGYNDTLSAACLFIAEELWTRTEVTNKWAQGGKMMAAVELFITTGKPEYSNYLVNNEKIITENIQWLGWEIGKALPLLKNKKFEKSIRAAVVTLSKQIETEGNETPFGVPYKPHIWGAGWGIQDFGVKQYYLYKAFPDLITKEYLLNALNFVLGCHPGDNTASFASGVGSRSTTSAYGYNRADWSYIPGGVVSGTALIRPDFAELKEFPYLWQQTEYVLGGGSSNFMFLVLAANAVLNQ